MDEAAAIHAYQRGHADAFAVLFELHAGHVYRTYTLSLPRRALTDAGIHTAAGPAGETILGTGNPNWCPQACTARAVFPPPPAQRPVRSPGALPHPTAAPT